MDRRKNNGGHKSAGRKSKSEEMKLAEMLNKHIDKDKAILELKKLIFKGDFKAINLYMNYMYGKPKESVDVTSKGETMNFPTVIFKKSK